MKKYDYNLVVIGAGSGGLVSAYIAATVKAKVALIEENLMGGDCLNTGCVPSKALIKSAKIFNYADRAKEFGFKKMSLDFEDSDIWERVQRLIKKVAPHDSVERYTQLGVECIQGRATVIDPHTVEVNGQQLSTRSIILASGGKPRTPKIPGLDDYLTSENLWQIRKIPQKLIVLGTGPVAVEIAQAMSRLGSQVSMIARSNQLLKREDQDVSELLVRHLRKEGIQLLFGHQTEAVVADDKGQKKLVCKHKEEQVELAFDQIFVAYGRQASVEGFGLEKLGIKLRSDLTIDANPFLQTNINNIFVCGDVTGPYQFTHMAAHQAWYATVNALFSSFKKFKVNYQVVPWCSFTDPEVASVGLNEKDAQSQNIAYEVTRYNIDDLDRAIVDSEAHGFVKVLTVPGKDKILGVTIVAAHAGELISEYILAMKYNLGLNKILGTTHIYPTFSEANKYVAGEWKKAHAPTKILQWLEKFHSWQRNRKS